MSTCHSESVSWGRPPIFLAGLPSEQFDLKADAIDALTIGGLVGTGTVAEGAAARERGAGAELPALQKEREKYGAVHLQDYSLHDIKQWLLCGR